MTRLTLIDDNAGNADASALLGAIKAKLGVTPNLYRVVANQPAALKALLGFGDELGKGAFDAKTREAIALTVAGANECDYCASAHSAISKSLKVDDAEIAARLHGKSADARLQSILTFSKAVVDKRGLVSDADLKAARDAGLSDSDIVETVANVVQNIFTNYINHVAQTDIDFPAVSAKAA